LKATARRPGLATVVTVKLELGSAYPDLVIYIGMPRICPRGVVGPIKRARARRCYLEPLELTVDR
jgi:hypothetical protein